MESVESKGEMKGKRSGIENVKESKKLWKTV